MTRHLRVLFDTGSSASFISRKVLPKGVIPRPICNVITTTISGSQHLQGIVTLRGIMFPEFTTSRRISTPINALVFDNDACSVDLIFGTDVLIPLGIDIHNSRQEVRWMDKTIPLYSQPKNKRGTTTVFYIEDTECHVNMTDAKYEKIDTNEVVQQQHHLDAKQKHDLARLLSRYDHLFSGKLGCFPHRKLHLELHANSRPAVVFPHPSTR